MADDKIKIFVVEDHKLFRVGLRSAMSIDPGRFEITGEADSGEKFFEALGKCDIDVLLLDIRLPGISGVEVARRLRAGDSEIKILVLSSENSIDVISQIVEVGVNGFISKDSDVKELLRAIECVYEGVEYFGKDISRLINMVRVANRDKAPDTEFTARENEIIAMCAKGLTAKEIANEMNISVPTVNTHKNNIFKKLGINNSVELVIYALGKGIISL